MSPPMYARPEKQPGLLTFLYSPVKKNSWVEKRNLYGKEIVVDRVISCLSVFVYLVTAGALRPPPRQ